MALAALIVRIGADLTDLNKGLTQGDKDVQKMGKRLSKLGGTLTQNLTVPVAAAAAGLAAAGIHVANFADELLDLVDMTGLSAKTLQEFRHVTSVAGVATDTLADAAIKLTSRLTAGDEQTKSLTNALGRLGLKATDAHGGLRSMDVLLPDIIGRLQGMSDITQRNTIAADIFGKSWSELAPVLGLGAGAMEKARVEANALGLVMSDKNVAAADEFRKGFNTLKESLGAIVNEIGVAMLPVMNKLVKLMQEDVVPAIRAAVKWFGDLSPGVKTTIAVVAGLAAAFGPLLVAVGTVMTMWPLISVAFAAITGPAAIVVLAIGSIAAAGYQLIKNWAAVKAQFVAFWMAMKDAVYSAIQATLDAMIGLAGKVPFLGDALRALKAKVDALATDSLLKGTAQIQAFEAEMLKSADATTTLVTKVVALGNALASLPKGLNLPGIQRGAAVGVGSDFDRNLGKGGPFKFTDDMIEGMGRNIPKPGALAESKPGPLSGAVNAGMGGSMGGQIVQAAAAFGPLAAIIPVISGAMEALEPVLTALVAPLVDIGRIIGDALAPVLEMLTPVIKLIADLFTHQLAPVLKAITFAISYVMEAFGWMVRGIGKLIDSLPGISAKGVINAGQEMIDAAKAARENKKATEKATDAIKSFSDALSNVPRVLNLHALEMMVTGQRPRRDRRDLIPGASSGNVYITVPGAGDPTAVAEAVGRAVERKRGRGGISRLTVAVNPA